MTDFNLDNQVTPNLNLNPLTPDPNQKLSQLIAEQNIKKNSAWGYVIWSLAIPPFTIFWEMYRAWKKGVLSDLVPIMTIVYSLIFAFWSMLMFSAPGAVSDYLHQQVGGISGFEKIVALVLVILGIFGGFYFRNKAKKAGSLSIGVIVFLTLILILQLWAGYNQLTAVSGVVNQQINTNIGI